MTVAEESNVITASAFEQARAAKAVLTAADLKVDRTYRAKQPAKAGDEAKPCYNDRTIMWMGGNVVQYDGPSVRFGRNYPKITVEVFLAWASHDVTDQLPEGAYQPWLEEQA